MLTVKVKNIKNPNTGREIPNQFLIDTPEGQYFQSYKSIIMFSPNIGKIKLDKNYWDYSHITSKYRNLLLEETKRETEKKIKDGTYELADLN